MEAMGSAANGLQPASEQPPTMEVPAARAWFSVAILLVLAFVSLLDRQIISLMVDPIKADLGLTDTQIGLLQGLAFTLFYCAAAIPLGWAVDRYRRTTICYLGVTVWSLGTLACGFAGSFWHLFAARIAVGAGEASLTPTSISLISDIFPPEKVGRAMGVFGSAIALGSGFALIAGGLVIGMLGQFGPIAIPGFGAIAEWQAVFIVIGLPGIVIAPLAFLMADRRSARASSAPSGRDEFFGYLRGNWRLIALILAGFSLAAFNFYAVASWTPAFLARVHGVPIATIGWTWGLVVACSGAIGAIVGGMAIDRSYAGGVDDAAIAVPAWAALASWPILSVAYQMPGPTAVLACLGIAAILSGVISAGAFSVWQRVAPPEMRGRLSAIFGLVSTGTGATLGPVLPAWITDTFLGDEARIGISLALVLCCATPLMAIALLAARRVLRTDAPLAPGRPSFNI